MSKTWHNAYPPEVPHDINADAYPNVPAMLDEAFRQHADSPYCVCMERWLSYGEIDQHSRHLAAWLQKAGLPQGARVAIMLPNIPQFPITMAAVLRAGYVCVNVNPLYTARELQHQLKDSGATAIVILENFAHTLQDILNDTPIKHVAVTSLGDMLGGLYGHWITFAVRHLARMVPSYKLPLVNAQGQVRDIVSFRQALKIGSQSNFVAPDIQSSDTAFLQYTGGTTGLSKGAVLTHRNIVAASLQAQAWFTPSCTRVGNLEKINCVAALPLYHIFALTLCFLTMRWGAHMTLIPNPRDIPKFVETLSKRPFHILPAVNTLFNALIQNKDFKTLDFSNLCISQAGGMAASAGTAKKWHEITGSVMIEGWGMSETCAIGTNNPTNSKGFTGTIGVPLPSIEIAIKNDEGHTVALGSTGEVCIKGPNVMNGYYNQPEETDKAFTADGFMRTGDIGIMDQEGFTRIVDRKKDMILVSGFNVFPNELENVISLCPGVVECAAVGVPDEKQGEAIKVFVVRSDITLTEEDVEHYCRQNLTGYKMPKYIEFREELPKTNVGKVLRRELRNVKQS